ncbi:diguanylate cyclase [Micrococcaceae bacterium Sec7.4]
MSSHSSSDSGNADIDSMSQLPAQVRAVLNGIPAMVGYWDKNLRNCLANDAYGEWFNVDPNQMHGMHIRELLGEDLFAANQAYIAEVLEGKPQLFDRTLVDASGRTRYTQASYVPDEQCGEVQGFFVLVTDITERVISEQRQKLDMDRYRALARSIPGVFVLLFDSDLRYLIAEGQELERFGHRSDEMEGRRIHEVLHEGLADELEPRYRSALAGQEVSWSRQVGHRMYRLTAGPVQSEGETVGMVVAVDVTERRRQEKTWAGLHEISSAIARNADPADIAEQVAVVVRSIFDVDSAAVTRFTGPMAAEIVAMAPVLPSVLSRRHVFAPTDAPATVRVAMTGKPALAVYVPGGGVAAEQLLEAGFRSSAAAPIRVSGSLWGAVALTSRSETNLTAAVLDQLAQFAELVEIAIGNAEARSSLELQASTDVLSGLPNRRVLEERLTRETGLAAARGTKLSAIVLDIDHFKVVNDTFGHLTGDRVLAEVASRLREVARPGEIVARFGGEEFVWLLPGSSSEEALQAAERARQAVGSRPFDGAGTITLSAGVCELQEAGSHALLACADHALYASKHAGRNRSMPYVAAADSRADRSA